MTTHIPGPAGSGGPSGLTNLGLFGNTCGTCSGRLWCVSGRGRSAQEAEGQEDRAVQCAERWGNKNGTGVSQGTQKMVGKWGWTIILSPSGKSTQSPGLPAKVTDPPRAPHFESHSEGRPGAARMHSRRGTSWWAVNCPVAPRHPTLSQ